MCIVPYLLDDQSGVYTDDDLEEHGGFSWRVKSGLSSILGKERQR